MMKKSIIYSIVSVVILATFTACSSSDDTKTGAVDSNIEDIVLTSGESVVCSDENSFSIESLNETAPDVTFQVNTTTGTTTITYKSIEGSATVIGCTIESS